MKLALVALVLLLVGIGTYVLVRGDARDRVGVERSLAAERGEQRAAADLRANDASGEPSASASRSLARERDDAAAGEARGAPAAAQAGETLRIRIVGTDAQPLGGVAFRTESGQALVSAADGWLEWPAKTRELLDGIEGGRVVLMLAHGRSADAAPADLALVGDARDVEVSVIDPSGSPAADATVRAEPAPALRDYPFPIDVTHERVLVRRGVADAAGICRLAAVPVALPVDVHATLGDARTTVEDAPVRSGAVTVRLELDTTPPETVQRSVTLRGTVLHADGRPAKKAAVLWQAEGKPARTDSEGRFELAYPFEADAATEEPRHPPGLAELALFARHDDGGLVRDPSLGALLAAHLPAEPPPFVLTLPGARGLLAGRVVDADGGRVKGWRIHVQDPTPTGFTISSDAHVEGLQAKSDGDGRFELPLLDPTRAYHLVAVSPVDGSALQAGPFTPGGEEAVIAVDGRAYATGVDGRVVSRSGAPLAGVQLVLNVDLARMSQRGSTVATHHEFGETVADAAGRFRFERVPLAGAYVAAKGTAELPLDDERVLLDPSSGDRELVFTRLVPFVPLVPDDAEEDGMIEVLDGDGEQLLVQHIQRSSRSASPTFWLSQKRTAHLWTSELGATVVLLRRDASRRMVEVARAPLPAWSGPEAGPLRIPLGGE